MSQKGAIKAGFDGIELHGARILLTEFLLLYLTSVMTDGEEISKDGRFLLAVLQEVKM